MPLRLDPASPPSASASRHHVVFFNAVWAWARRGHRLLDPALSATAARRIGRGFLAGPVLYLVGTLLGAAIPLAGLAVFAALILVYWLPVKALGQRPPPV